MATKVPYLKKHVPRIREDRAADTSALLSAMGWDERLDSKLVAAALASRVRTDFFAVPHRGKA
eukprot:4654701-Amphidinium_carterae.1